MTFVMWPHLIVGRASYEDRGSAESKMAKIRNIEQLCNQLTEPIFNLQKNSYMFRLPSVAILREKQYSNIQGGSNMTGTDLCVNKPYYAAAVRP